MRRRTTASRLLRILIIAAVDLRFLERGEQGEPLRGREQKRERLPDSVKVEQACAEHAVDDPR